MTSGVAFEEIVTAGSTKLFTRAVGNGPEVAILHGGPGAHHDYLLPQFDGLAPGRKLLYYDQRGGGRSQIPNDMPCGWQQHVQDLLNLLDHWHIDRAALVGYSWGGLLAMLFAVNHPDRVERLALVSPAPSNAAARRQFETRFQERMKAPNVVEARTALKNSSLRETDPAAYKKRAFELSIAGYFADIHNAKDLTPFRVTARTQEAVWKSLGEYDIRENLTQLAIPALVLHGTHDPIPLESAKDTAEHLKADLVVFENSGHVLHVEEEQKFIETLNPFFAATP